MTTESEQAPSKDIKYYWLGDLLLNKDSIVLPGNWLRIINSTPGHHLSLREYIYEKVRKEEFSELPSRFTSSFICRGINYIKAFQDKNGRQSDILYEVEIINEKALKTTLDSELLGVQNMSEGGRLLSANELVEKARLYWSSSQRADIKIPEVIVDSPIIIINRVE